MHRKYKPAPSEVGLAEFLVEIVCDLYGPHWQRFSFHLFPLAGDQLWYRSQAEWYNGLRKWTPNIIPPRHKAWIRKQVGHLVRTAQADLPHVNGIQIHLDPAGLVGVDYVFDFTASPPEFLPDLVPESPLMNTTVINFCMETLNQPGIISIDFWRFTFFATSPGNYSGWFRYGTGASDQIQLVLPPEVKKALMNLHRPPDWNVLQIDFSHAFRPTIECRHDPIIADLVAVQATP